MFANVLEDNKQNILRAIHELNKHTWIRTLVNIYARSNMVSRITSSTKRMHNHKYFMYQI